MSDSEVTVTNGATEAIYTIAENNVRQYGTDGFTNIISRPTFSEYADACMAYGSGIACDCRHATGHRVHWLCNPNNPTGSVIPAKQLLDTADAHPGDLFIIDQSYEHYTLEPAIADHEAVCRRNIILLHSMTKRFCVPGLRLGYAVANSETTARLKRLRRPWSVNSLAIEAGLFLVGNNINLMPDTGAYLAEAQRLRQGLQSVSGVSVAPTHTNFMLACIKGHTAASLKEYLVTRHGLLIRDASNFEGLSPSHFRVAAQGRQADDMLVEAIREFAASAV